MVGDIPVSKQAHRTRLRIRPLACVAIVASLAVTLHLAVLTEGPHWRSPLLAGEWLFNILLATSIFTYSLAIGRRFARSLLDLTGDGLADGLAALGLGFGLLSTLILLAGFLGLYYGPIFLLLFLVLTVVLRGELMAILYQSTDALLNWARAGLPTAPERGQRLVLAVLALTALHVLMRSMLPLTDWDAVVYHLASVKTYLVQHRVIPLPDMPLANAPAAEEMLFLTGLMAGSDGLGKILNLGFALLLCLSLYVLARRLSSHAAGWHAVLLLLTSFWIVAVLPLTLTDFASAFLLVAAVSDACAWAERYAATGDATRRAKTRRLLVRGALLAGCAAACKLSTLPILPAFAGTLALCATIYGGPNLVGRLTDGIKVGATVSVATLLPLVPWLLKNVYFFGAPFYPYGSVTVSNLSQGTTIAGSTPAPNQRIHWLMVNLGDFLWNHVSVLTVFLLVAAVVLRRPAQRAAIIFLGIALTLWLLFVPYFDPPRYYLGLAALAQALNVAVVYEALPSLRLVERWRQLGMAGYLLVRSVPNLLVGLGVMGGSLLGNVARGDVSQYDYLASQVRPYMAEAWVNANVPPGTEIAMVNVVTAYYLDRPNLNDWYGTRLVRLEGGTLGRQAELASWCSAGVRYVIFDRGDGSPEFHGTDGARPLASYAWTRVPGLQARPIYSANDIDVLSVRPCAALTTGKR